MHKLGMNFGISKLSLQMVLSHGIWFSLGFVVCQLVIYMRSVADFNFDKVLQVTLLFFTFALLS